MTTWNIRGDTTDNYLNTDDIVVEFITDEEKKEINSLDWLNWMSLDMDKQNDSIHIHLSTNDPRDSQFSISLTRPIQLENNTKCLIFEVRKDKYY
jgi:hypothetical protein